MDDKDTIRRAFAMARDAIPLEAVVSAGEKVAARLGQFLDACGGVRVAACYASRKSELPTGPAMHALREHSVAIALPAWDGATYRFAEWKADAPLSKGPMSIPQPADGYVLETDEIDLFLVPGIAFDTLGGRIGYGGGWYDRLLAGRRTDSVALGLCFDVQISDEPLPLEPHDVALDGLLTPSNLFSRRTDGN